ncbi:hypothetical protein R3P38DRAFT_2492769 [Favolaschia claudopus]|uniref:Uncharacterized protein n=1 Tax=Favolaschia claudopus TaxID=2862362 RepID=A0AAW0EHM5_9AGAR
MAVLPSPLVFIASIPPVTRGFTAATVVTSLFYAWLVWTGATADAPYLVVVPGSSLFFPWTFVTSVLVETSIWELIMSLVFVPPSLRYLERVWGSIETLKFIAVSVGFSNIIAFGFNWIEFMATRNADMFLYGMQYHGQMALQIAILVAFTQLIPEHQVQLFGVLKARVKTLPMAYLTLSTVMTILGFQCPWIIIQFGWFVGWIYLRFYKKNTGDSVGGIDTYGDRSETFSLVSWFPPFMHYPLGLLGNFVYTLANRFHLIPASNGDLESGAYSQVPGSARAEAERRRAMALKALDQRLANTSSPSAGNSQNTSPPKAPRVPPPVAATRSDTSSSPPAAPLRAERTKTNGSIKAIQSPTVAAEAPPLTRRFSVTKLPTDVSELDPDELFTRHTVAEVKVVQQRLRADADAKQEELRLMVGERYRDLLQASTSIIDIARSSKRVIEALQETKDAILSQDEPPMPQRTSAHAGGDGHLHTLQLLSAHLKLLLDAPEHLWRLIERKKYFTAAWLFLLARVVHRALVRDDDEQDEEAWSAQGLDVLEQFPLAQRQWEAVSQFRSQIIHKATLFLREYTLSAEDACAALLTLHLLDSRPLTETLSVYLNQRSKTLLTLLSRSAEHSPISPLTSSLSRRPNGHIPDKTPASGARKTSVREVKEATQAAVDGLVKTLTSSRTIYEKTDSEQSMIGAVLEYIQSDASSSESNFKSLPLELQLTTHSLLATLPSSTHFLLLPSALRSYKPYVDLSSASSLIEQPHFNRVLDEWFETSNKSLKIATSKWFSDLHSVAEVWTLRASIRQWIDESSLKPAEIKTLDSTFEDAAQQRVLDIWKLALSDAEDAFQLQLAAATTTLRTTSRKDTSPIDFLFTAPPLPVLPGLGPADSSFQKYKGSLRRQLLGRTSLLDSVLATLENCARSLQRDLAVVLGGGDEGARSVAAQLSKQYRPNAEALCTGILDTLSAAEKEESEYDELKIQSLVFVGHVSDELSTSSPFAASIGGGADVVQGSGSRNNDNEADKALRLFVHEWVGEGWKSSGTQTLCDIALLRRLADLRAPEWEDVCQLLDRKAEHWKEQLQQRNPSLASGWNDGAAEYLARTQTLFAALLPPPSPMRIPSGHVDKFAPLLPWGSPALDQQFQSAVELAKPSSRFGLLLVGQSAR